MAIYQCNLCGYTYDEETEDFTAPPLPPRPPDPNLTEA